MKVVVVAPGRGTYGRSELGSLMRRHGRKPALIGRWEALRRAAGRESLAALDGAESFSVARHMAGQNAAALIFACGYADAQDLAGVEVLAVTGNSMGWYTALAVAGALSGDDGFLLADTMGSLMAERGRGGQVVYPVGGADWVPDAARRTAVMEAAQAAGLMLSIDLGGLLVLAGETEALERFEGAVPPVEGRFPLRLGGHAAFHTPLVADVGVAGRRALAALGFGQPRVPMIDGRGAVWWPHAVDPSALADYTFGHQVAAPYDFARAIRVAAREFNPDAFVVLGPGDMMGGAVAQSLIAADWRGLASRDDFMQRQAERPVILSMGRDDQRAAVTGG